MCIRDRGSFIVDLLSGTSGRCHARLTTCAGSRRFVAGTLCGFRFELTGLARLRVVTLPAQRREDPRLLHHFLERLELSLIHISEPTRLLSISYAVFCLKK